MLDSLLFQRQDADVKLRENSTNRQTTRTCKEDKKKNKRVFPDAHREEWKNELCIARWKERGFNNWTNLIQVVELIFFFKFSVPSGNFTRGLLPPAPSRLYSVRSLSILLLVFVRLFLLWNKKEPLKCLKIFKVKSLATRSVVIDTSDLSWPFGTVMCN